jgi:hypothetical protein
MSSKLNKLFAKKDAQKAGTNQGPSYTTIQETQLEEGEFGITGDRDPAVATVILSKADGSATLDTRVLPRAGGRQVEQPKEEKKWKSKEELEAERAARGEEPEQAEAQAPKEEPAKTGTYRVGALRGGPRGGVQKVNLDLNDSEAFPTLGAAPKESDGSGESSSQASGAPNVATNAWVARGR